MKRREREKGQGKEKRQIEKRVGRETYEER